MLNKTYLFIIFIDTSFDHLFNDSKRLRLVFVESLSFQNLFLFFDLILRYFVHFDVRRVSGCDLHTDVVSKLLACVAAHLYDYAYLTAHVYIAVKFACVGIFCKSSDSYLLADLSDCLSQCGSHILADLLNAVNVVVGNIFSNLHNKSLVLLASCNKVAFAVYFYEYAALVVDISFNDTLGCDFAGSLCAGSHSLFSQYLYCLLHIAVSFGKSLFTIHHTDARLGA